VLSFEQLYQTLLWQMLCKQGLKIWHLLNVQEDNHLTPKLKIFLWKGSVCINTEERQPSRLEKQIKPKNISTINYECCHLSTLYQTLLSQMLCKQGLLIWPLLNADNQKKFDKEDNHEGGWGLGRVSQRCSRMMGKLFKGK